MYPVLHVVDAAEDGSSEPTSNPQRHTHNSADVLLISSHGKSRVLTESCWCGSNATWFEVAKPPSRGMVRGKTQASSRTEAMDRKGQWESAGTSVELGLG